MSLPDEFNEAVQKTVDAGRDDLLATLIDGLTEILRHPGTDEQDEASEPSESGVRVSTP